MFTPDMVLKCEYYERQERDVDLIILSHGISGAEQRHWAEEFDEDELAEAKVLGWTAKTVKRKRCRVRKFTMTGAEVLSDDGFIAGRSIPIVPIYFRRWYVDNVERFRGYVSKKMDPQRLYNSKVAKLAETDSLAPREVPIFDPDQVPGEIGQMWANQNIERFPYLLAKALRKRGDWGWVHVNLIPLNPTPGSKWTASRPQDQREFVRRLELGGIPVTVRDTRGREIDGACGQLAASERSAVRTTS